MIILGNLFLRLRILVGSQDQNRNTQDSGMEKKRKISPPSRGGRKWKAQGARKVEMNMLIWNERGLNNSSRAQDILGVIRDRAISLFGLLETKVQYANFNKIEGALGSFCRWEYNYASENSGRQYVGIKVNLAWLKFWRLHRSSTLESGG